MKTVDVVIIGGGSAGMAAAIELKKQGIEDLVMIERDVELGGILNQCIHNGFGLHTFKEELCGPSYAQKYIDIVEKLAIPYLLNTTVMKVTNERVVTFVNEAGYQQVQAKAIVLANGCRERTRGAISIPGTRPKGIWSAGTAQRYLNIDGYLVGKNVFILGSGDIGLIMARRMTLEGANVLGVAELMPYSNGLPRNIKQCLEDFEIPLFLRHTVIDIAGEDSLEQITICEVDDQMQPIKGKERVFEVDTLLLSVGLLPETSIADEAKIDVSPKTKGPMVTNAFETSVEGIFACGNALHVHDLVDYVSAEAICVGKEVAKYLLHQPKEVIEVQVEAANGIAYVLPNKITSKEDVTFSFRVNGVKKDCQIVVRQDQQELMNIKKAHLLPAEMEKLTIKKELLKSEGTLSISIEEYR